MSNTLLSISNLSSGYGDFQALFDVSFELNAGKILSLIGANGAGKSTLLRAITGLNKCEAQMVHFKGEAIGGMAADKIARKGIAMVPEGRRLFRSLSVKENLMIGAEHANSGYWTFDKVCELFPILAEKQNSGALDLSGGQQQMVAIGRALMANPELLIFDEISLGLAPVIIKDIYKALPAIIDTGVSAILVEQDVSRALAVSKQFVCLQEGRVSLKGNTENVTRHEITAAYFGS